MPIRDLPLVGNGRLEPGGAPSTLVFILGVLAFLALLYWARHPLFRLAGGMWVVEDRVPAADAIIVLSDDNFYADRATRAAELYRQELAPLVVASGRCLRSYAGIAELMEHDLFERGVPKERILAARHRADNTREEAQVMLELAKQRKWRRIIVVTSSYHTRRARYIYRHVFPGTLPVYVASARDGDFDPEHWWEKRVSVKMFAREMVGMLVAIWELGGKTGSGHDEAERKLLATWKSGIFVAVLGPGQPVSVCRKEPFPERCLGE
jgi:uncharacterized SAM-binding protein YcdF (DUF218 family)